MSVRIEIFESLSSKLKDMNFFKIIDIYKGQFSEEDANSISSYPAAYVSISNIEYEETTVDFVEGNATIDIYVFFRQFENTDILDKNKPSTLEMLKIMDDIVDELHGTSGKFFSELSQNAEEDLSFRYGKPAFRMSFSTGIVKRIEANNYTIL